MPYTLNIIKILSSCFVITFVVLSPAFANPVNSCGVIFSNKNHYLLAGQQSKWRKLPADEQYRRRKELMYKPSTFKQIQRRPIIKTSGLRQSASSDIDPADVKIDTADPSLVMPITYPNNVTKYRINFSGMRFIEADSPAELFLPGIQNVKRSRGFYKDGTEMIGAYHTDAWPWDVVIYKNDKNEWIALGGVMRQPEPGKLPNVQQHNQSRSRWWGKVSHIEITPGVFEEHIIWQAPVHDFNLSEHKTWKYHGYGGTLVTEFNFKTKLHEPVKNENGNYTLTYERVTEEKDGQPWITTTFMREIDPSLKRTVGPEIETTNLTSPKTGNLFEALRRGDDHTTAGYLREGDNVLKELKKNQFIKVGSANDYVRKYGIYMDYRDSGTGFVGPYKNVTDDQGQLIDFATTLKLRELFNATWVGRPQLNYDPNGKLWLLFHFVPIESIPNGAPVEGWPSKENFTQYGRITALIPVKIEHDKKGQPLLVKDIDPEFAYMFE